MSDDELVEVYLAANAPQAYFLRNMLADVGIEASVTGDITTIGVFTGEESGPCLWVRGRDKDQARVVLEEWERANVGDHRAEDPLMDSDETLESK